MHRAALAASVSPPRINARATSFKISLRRPLSRLALLGCLATLNLKVLNRPLQVIAAIPPGSYNGFMKLMKRKRIGFLGYDGLQALDLVGPLEAFMSARPDDSNGGREVLYETVVIGLTNKPFTAETGLVLYPHTT